MFSRKQSVADPTASLLIQVDKLRKKRNDLADKKASIEANIRAANDRAKRGMLGDVVEPDDPVAIATWREIAPECFGNRRAQFLA